MDELLGDSEVNPNRVGIRADVLMDILNDLNSHPELQRIFGQPVLYGLVVVSDHNDLRIEDGGIVPLTTEDEERFLSILQDIIEVNAT